MFVILGRSLDLLKTMYGLINHDNYKNMYYRENNI